MDIRKLLDRQPEKADELVARLKARRGTGSQRPVLRRVQQSQPLPMSFAQESLWARQQIDGGTGYVMVLAYRLRGALDANALRRAMNALVKRHEILRTVFDMVDGTPTQVRQPAPPTSMWTLDLSALPEPVAVAVESTTKQAIQQRRVELRDETNFWACLIRRGPDEHLLVLRAHHILMDGVSFGVLWEELITLYKAFSAGQPSPLPELELQYADFAHWERQWLSGDRLQAEREYWQTHLEDMPALEVPTDAPFPRAQSSAGDAVGLGLEPDLVRQVADLSTRLRLTPFMVYLAVCAILLRRYSGLRDVNLISGSAKRTDASFERMLGNFADLMVVRVKLRGDPKVTDFLEQVRDTVLDLFDHLDYPYARIRQEMPATRGRDPSHQGGHSMVALFWQTFARTRLDLPGLEISQEGGGGDGDSRGELVFVGWEGEDSLYLEIQYRTQLFQRQTVERMGQHLVRLAQMVATRPELRVSELSMLTEGEEEKLREWSGVSQTALPVQYAHEQLDQLAQLSPDRVAVEHAANTLRYGELARLAERAAGALQQREIGPESVVGLALDRAIDLVPAMLAVMKTGAAFLPLSPRPAPERFRELVRVGQPSAIVLESSDTDLKRFADAAGVRTIDWEPLAQEHAPWTSVAVHPDALACVLHSADSDRQVAVPHRALSRLSAVAGALDIQTGDRLGWTCRYGQTVQETFLALLAGATLVDVADAPLDPLDGNPTVLLLPTGVFEDLAEKTDAFSGVRTLVVEGDAMTPTAVGRILAGGGAPQIHQVYGTTEAPLALVHRVRAEETDPTIPLGHPLPGAQVLILDQDLNLVPPNVTGQIFLGGEGLGRCYVDLPGPTARDFVPNPHGPMGSRLVRTGDLGRHRPDGTVQFAARIDDQMQNGGYGVEPAEIEHRLESHPAIHKAIVVSDQDELVAFVVSKAGSEPTSTELLAWLRQTLPEYKVPVAFRSLDGVPLTSTGRTDRTLVSSTEAPALETAEERSAKGRVEDKRLALQRLIGTRKKTGETN